MSLGVVIYELYRILIEGNSSVAPVVTADICQSQSYLQCKKESISVRTSGVLQLIKRHDSTD